MNDRAFQCARLLCQLRKRQVVAEIPFSADWRRQLEAVLRRRRREDYDVYNRLGEKVAEGEEDDFPLEVRHRQVQPFIPVIRLMYWFKVSIVFDPYGLSIFNTHQAVASEIRLYIISFLPLECLFPLPLWAQELKVFQLFKDFAKFAFGKSLAAELKDLHEIYPLR